MPGRARYHAWSFAKAFIMANRSGTGILLRKFTGSKASDPRDQVYALFGITSDAEDMEPDYSKTYHEVVTSTITSILRLEGFGILITCLPPCPLPLFLEEFPNISDLRESLIIDAFNKQESTGILRKFRNNLNFAQIRSLQERWKTGQTVAEINQTLAARGDTGYGLLLNTNQGNIDHCDNLSSEGTIPPPLL